MSKKDAQENFNFSSLYNRTEKRVKRKIQAMIDNNDSRLASFNEKDILDVVAIACTSLPAKYVHKGTIVMGDTITKASVESVINDSIAFVRDHPKV